MNKKLRAGLYLRVSTDEQTKGYGLKFQEEKLRAFTSSQDYSLDEKHVYIEEGYSGSLPSDQRPKMTALFQAAQNKEFDVVLVYRLDRFFRKTRLLLDGIERLTVLGIGFKSVTESFDTTNITGRFMTTLLGAVAEMERDTIRERTTNGRILAARDGKWVTGVPPYGYKLDKKTKKLSINESEAELVRKFFQWIAIEKISLREAEVRANASGISSPGKGSRSKQSSGIWHKRSIGRIITNESYTGIAYFRKYKRPFNNLTSITDPSKLRDKDEWIAISVPSIVSRELYEATKAQLMKNREFSVRNQKRSYLFSKIVYCGSCGFKLFGGFQPPRNKGESVGKYYHGVCSKGLGNTKRCTTCLQVAESRLYPVWEELAKIIKHPKQSLLRLHNYNLKSQDRKNLVLEVENVNKSLQSLQKKRERLAQIFSSDETVEFETYNKELSNIRAKELELKEHKTKLEQRLMSKDGVIDYASRLKEQQLKLIKKVDTITYEEKQQVIRTLVNKIVVFPKKNFAEVELNISDEQGVESPYPATEKEAVSSLRDSRSNKSPTINSFFLRIPLLPAKRGRNRILSIN